MKFIAPLLLIFAIPLPAQEAREMLIIVSEPGNPTYELEFRRQATAWQDLAANAKIEAVTIGLEMESPDGDKSLVKQAFTALPKTGADLWLVWIGHGSFDGRTANFNLRGQDIDSVELRDLLKPFTRRLIILNLFSASAPFLPVLAGENRVIVSAGRSDGERNFSRFGGKFADALTATDADLDLDASLSLLEATLYASSKTQAFYEDAQRVLQEHAVIDDNGDGIGSPSETFKGFRAEIKASSENPPDGAVSREIYFLTSTEDPLSPEARVQRAKLEAAIDALRKRKSQLLEADYYQQLEVLMLQMARLYGKTTP